VPFTDTIEQLLLDHFLDDAAFTPDADLYIGLSSTTPNDAGGNVTEPSGGAYARVLLATTSFGAASGTAPAEKTNSAALSFPQATADWVAGANLTHFVVFNALTAGTCRAWGALAVAKPVLNGDTASFAIGALDFRLGKGTAL
jgi:hypothetical protein